MTTTRTLGTALASVALMLSACGGDDGPTVTADVESVPIAEEEDESVDKPTEEPEPEPEPEPDEDPEPEKPDANVSQRGNLIKKMDEVAGLSANESDTIDDAWFQFKITDIESGDQTDCTEDPDFVDPPENGHFLFITIVASTSSDWPGDLVDIYISAFDFSVIGPDGITENDVEGSALWCLAERDSMPRLGPGENITGKVVLDIASPSGVLVYKPWFADYAGWEWEF